MRLAGRSCQDGGLSGNRQDKSKKFEAILTAAQANIRIMQEQEHYPRGCLFVVATPIGNLADMSPRARAILELVDVIAAEDTRHSGALLQHLGITTALQSLHEHNEAQGVPALIARLRAGERVALISDAGTPLISDPGFLLVREARAAGLELRSVPGACAAVAALAVAGLPSDRFVFEGFLPHRAGPRKRRLTELAPETRSLLLYESSHRIAQAAADIADVLGPERRVCLARELTKLYEQSVALAAGELPAWLAADSNRCRGEFVLVVAGAPPDDSPGSYPVVLDALLREFLGVMPVAQAAKAAAKLTGAPRNQVYQRALELG